jgi:hypothetical protein
MILRVIGTATVIITGMLLFLAFAVVIEIGDQNNPRTLAGWGIYVTGMLHYFLAARYFRSKYENSMAFLDGMENFIFLSAPSWPLIYIVITLYSFGAIVIMPIKILKAIQ